MSEELSCLAGPSPLDQRPQRLHVTPCTKYSLLSLYALDEHATVWMRGVRAGQYREYVLTHESREGIHRLGGAQGEREEGAPRERT
jgi:hypothetical protein